MMVWLNVISVPSEYAPLPSDGQDSAVSEDRSDHIEDDRQDDTDEKHRSDRDEDPAVLALNVDVSGKAPEPRERSREEANQGTSQQEDRSEDH